MGQRLTAGHAQSTEESSATRERLLPRHLERASTRRGNGRPRGAAVFFFNDTATTYIYTLSLHDALPICALEQPVGVAVSFGGQTPLRLAPALAAAGLPLLGDPLDAIDAAEDRSRFAALAGELSPPWGAAADADEARTIAERIGYPVLVRPHHVLGGRGMHVAYASDELRVEGPCLVDRFLAGALELDVDALCDGESAWVAAILEHVEPAGVHSGDSACVFPGPSVTEALEEEIREVAGRIAHDLGARGLLNLQLAV